MTSHLPTFALLLAAAVLVSSCDGCDERETPGEDTAEPATPEPTPPSQACVGAEEGTLGTLEVALSAGGETFPGSCAPDLSGARIYRFDIAERSRLQVDTKEAEDAVLWVSRGCGDEALELACEGFGSDEPLNLDRVVEPGTYFVAVAPDPELDPSDSATIDIGLESIAALEARCSEAPELRPGETHRGTTRGAPDRFVTPCHEIMTGPEAMHRLVLSEPQVVKLNARMAGEAALWTLQQCPAGPLPRGITCKMLSVDEEGDAEADEYAALRREVRDDEWRLSLDAGEHFVLVDSFEADGVDYELSFTVVSEP